MSVYIIQLPDTPRLPRRVRWHLAPDFPAYATLDQTKTVVENWLDGDWRSMVNQSGGQTEIVSVSTYQDRTGRPVARIVGLEVVAATVPPPPAEQHPLQP